MSAAVHPEVSIIIPAHNYGRFIRDAIDSVRAQTIAGWECIVVDDGSSDDTNRVLVELSTNEPRLKVVRQSQRGVSAARNTGIHAARAQFVQFLDADDMLSPEKLAIHLRAFDRHPTADIVYGPSAYFDDAEPRALRSGIRRTGPSLASGVDGTGSVMLSSLLDENCMTIEAPLIRRALLNRIGGFDETLRHMEDWDLWLRCAIGGARFVYEPNTDARALVRVHGGSASSGEISMLLGMIEVREKIGGMLERDRDRSLNGRRMDESRAYVAMLMGRRGLPLTGLRIVAPAIFSGRRPRGVLTALRLVRQAALTSRLAHGVKSVLRPRS